jgi:BNR/Asp-box repeat protein
MTLRNLLLSACGAVALLGAGAGPAAAGSLSFTSPQQLPHGNPAQHPYYSGGEPSIAYDPNGDGHVYVTAPQLIPSALDQPLGASDATVGVGFWGSADHGATFPTFANTGAANGGGDSDVAVLPDHTVLVADLEAIAADICTSHDFGQSFQDCQNGLATNQQGPENDREWLTPGTQPGEVYLTYHDFVAGFPIIERSTDGGQTFQPCGTIIDPSGPAAQTYTPQGGTLVSKPIVAPDGTVYVEFTTPDQNASPVGASLDHLYMAVAQGGCTGQTVFKDYVIYQDPGASLANIFQQTARDAGGTLYVLTAGQTAAGQDPARVWLFTSTDNGQTWSAPIAVPMPGQQAAVFPTIAGGQGKGEAILGWFGTATDKDPNNTSNQWRYYAAATYDGGRTFNETTVTPDVIHYGDICTQGVFCGLVPGQPGNRNLADFASAAIDPATGCAALAVPGDPYNRPDLPNGANNGLSSAYVALQTDQATCFTPANAGKDASQVPAPRAAAARSRVKAARKHCRTVRRRVRTKHGTRTVKRRSCATSRARSRHRSHTRAKHRSHR